MFLFAQGVLPSNCSFERPTVDLIARFSPDFVMLWSDTYSRTQVPRATIVRSQFARTLRSSDGYTISFRNGSIAAM